MGVVNHNKAEEQAREKSGRFAAAPPPLAAGDGDASATQRSWLPPNAAADWRHTHTESAKRWAAAVAADGALPRSKPRYICYDKKNKLRPWFVRNTSDDNRQVACDSARAALDYVRERSGAGSELSLRARAREPRARRWPDVVAEAYAREAAPDVTFAFGARTRDGGHIECREVPGRLRGAVAAADGRAARCPEADVAYVNASGRVDRERTSAHRRRVTAEVRLLRDYERAAAPPPAPPRCYDVRRLGDAAWRSFDSPEDAIRGFPCAHRPPVWDSFETCARARSRRRRFGRCSDESSSLGARFAERAGAHASSARPSTSGGRFECGAGGFPGLTREACADLVDACVEINHWFGGSPPNFRTLRSNPFNYAHIKVGLKI